MIKDLNEMQSMMLDMIKWFHSFCQKNGIRYYVVGGTMLGAIRHKGFIPWDDDIDIGIPRKDYERLVKEKPLLFKGEERYLLETYLDGNKDFEYPFAKLYDTHTTLVENCRCHTRRGIYIDVFPLDGIGSTKEESLSNFIPIQKRVDFLMTRICEIRKSRKLYKNIAILISRLIPSFILSNHSLIHGINCICSKRDFDSCFFVGNLLGNWGKKEIMPKSYFGVPTLYDFEDTKVYGPENYEKYLSNVYNDWKKLPPVEKQVSHHDFVYMNLHEPYIVNN